ncbi:hypothetical protein [Malaciobacter marinus]|jgi:type II secretory pathway pseudopilin PulG|uniref:hypothetical protein n=1 Tax=Malaciobacter marinus TaxID=505249 RepID=UPI0009A57972|nr:hypothetical protein [Malaciobacter marinus]SKB68154.1 hypothetical protein SAMN06295997_13033 [Malaciobacter marinus]
MNKKSYSLIELLFALTLITIISASFYSNISLDKFQSNIDHATNRLILYLKQTRYQALIDSNVDENQEKWHKKRWTLKFFDCREKVGGLYYVIYSDKNMKGHPNKQESLKDPLSSKYIYSSNKCLVDNDTSKYVLLTKEFGIEKIDVSCKMDSSLGKISFGEDGFVYKKLSNNKNEHYKYKINKPCIIKLYDKNNSTREIVIEHSTGYIYKKPHKI